MLSDIRAYFRRVGLLLLQEVIYLRWMVWHSGVLGDLIYLRKSQFTTVAIGSRGDGEQQGRLRPCSNVAVSYRSTTSAVNTHTQTPTSTNRENDA